MDVDLNTSIHPHKMIIDENRIIIYPDESLRDMQSIPECLDNDTFVK